MQNFIGIGEEQLREIYLYVHFTSHVKISMDSYFLCSPQTKGKYGWVLCRSTHV